MKLMHTLLVGACISLAGTSTAQELGFGPGASTPKVSTTAGFHLSIPFGGQKSERAADKARFGLALNMTREYGRRNSYIPKRVQTNILDFGWRFDGQPTMLMGGEDVYQSLLNDQLNANGGVSKNTILIVAGGALAAGAAVALAGSGGNNDNDNDGPDNDNDGDD